RSSGASSSVRLLRRTWFSLRPLVSGISQSSFREPAHTAAPGNVTALRPPGQARRDFGAGLRGVGGGQENGSGMGKSDQASRNKLLLLMSEKDATSLYPSISDRCPSGLVLQTRTTVRLSPKKPT